MAIFFGLASIAFIFRPEHLTRYHYVLAAAIVAGLSYLIGVVLTLHSLPPQQYALLSISGRSVEETFLFISWRIWRVCRRFESYSRFFGRLENKLVGDQNCQLQEPDERGKAFTRLLQRKHRQLGGELKILENRLRRQHKAGQRIHAMKRLAAEELRIPARRLCAHVFQYSPGMHLSLVTEYLHNWKELQVLAENWNGHTATMKLEELLSRCRAIRDEARYRMKLQTHLMQNYALHPYIHRLASAHSTSSAVRTYADALAKLASRELGALHWKLGRFLVRPESRPYKACDFRFRVLHRKQKAHPGFDLNSSLIRVCQVMQSHYPEHFDKDRLDRQKLVLERLRDCGGLREATSPRGGAQWEPVLCTPPHSTFAKTVLETLTALKSLPLYVDQCAQIGQRAIVERFKEFYRLFLASRAGTSGRVYIVTHGYSKTTLAILIHGLSELLGHYAGEEYGRSLQTIDPQQRKELLRRMPHLFLLRTGDLKDEQETLDTQLMEYELKRNSRLRGFANLATGDNRMFRNLLSRNDRVVILLGAECFDRENNVVHPHGLNEMGSLSRDLRRRVPNGCAVIVAAESFKYQSELLANTDFYSNHFDRVAIYPSKSIDVVLRDDAIPQDWLRRGGRLFGFERVLTELRMRINDRRVQGLEPITSAFRQGLRSLGRDQSLIDGLEEAANGKNWDHARQLTSEFEAFLRVLMEEQ